MNKIEFPCEKCEKLLSPKDNKCSCGDKSASNKYYKDFMNRLKKRKPFGSYIIFTLYIFLNTQMIAIDINESIFSAFFGGNPNTPLNRETLHSFGGLSSSAVLKDLQGWRLITSGFLSQYLTLNYMTFLFYLFIAPAIERIMGVKKFLFIFFMSNILGGLVTLTLLHDHTVYGTHFFPIFGVCASSLALCYKNKSIYPYSLCYSVKINSLLCFLLAYESYKNHLILIPGLVAALSYGICTIFLSNKKVTFQSPVLILSKDNQSP